MTNYRQEDGEVHILYDREEDSTKRFEKLGKGIYQVWDAGGMGRFIPAFYPFEEKDRLIRFKSGIVDTVIKRVSDFLSPEAAAVYAELGIFHKVGMIFHGKHGTGKTSVCYLIMKEMVEKHDAICLDFTAKTMGFILYTLNRVRETQDNPIVVFVDEFENLVKREEAKLLTFLDGGDAINKTVFICCTNYLDKIPDRIKFRKSRIKYLYVINSLPESVYREYILSRLPKISTKELEELVFWAVDKQLTIDELKHVLIDYRLEKVSIIQAVDGVLQFVREGYVRTEEEAGEEEAGEDEPFNDSKS